MKRLLITGATGFLGRACLPLLIHSDFEIHATYHCQPPYLTDANIIWHQMDLLADNNLDDWVEALAPSHLLHLAWEVTPGKSLAAFENLAWLKTSLALLEGFVRGGGGHVLITGSCLEYEPTDTGVLSETTALNPQSLYGHCKTALLQVLKGLAQQKLLTYTWARLFYLYGPDEHPNRLVSSVIRSLLNNETAQCSSGEPIRDFMHVNDAARNCVALLNNQYFGEINVATGDGIALKDLIKLMGALCQTPDLIALGALPNRPNEAPVIVADIARLQACGFNATEFTLETGLAQTIQWWQQQLSLPPLQEQPV